MEDSNDNHCKPDSSSCVANVTDDRTSTITTFELPETPEVEERLLLRLKKPKTGKKVVFTAETVDNEHMNKNKSKCCCIYKKPKQFDESSSESEDDCENCYGHGDRGQKPPSPPASVPPIWVNSQSLSSVSIIFRVSSTSLIIQTFPFTFRPLYHVIVLVRYLMSDITLFCHSVVIPYDHVWLIRIPQFEKSIELTKFVVYLGMGM